MPSLLRGRRGFLVAICCVLVLPFVPSAKAQPVELELVLAVDASSSVSSDELELQMSGIAEAFRDPAVIGALEALGDGGIAVSLMQWSSPNQQDFSVGWAYVYDESSAREFADVIETTGRVVPGGATAIGSALEASLALLDGNGFEGRRQAIDISGDGRSNMGTGPSAMRDRAVARGITINGLAVLSDEPGVARHYEEEVIGGPGAFLIAVEDFDDFAEAMLEKLVREIAGAPVAHLSPERHVEHSSQSRENARPAIAGR